ncbi:MAG TPA: acyl-CoA dehydrogenase family protein [Streptosporangiaceae bacterium]
MDFTWSPAQGKTYDRIVDGARDLPPDGPGPFGTERWRRCGDLGVLGLSVPEEYGGQGLGVLDTARAAEAFGLGHSDMGLVFAAMAHLYACVMPIAEHGDDGMRSRMLPRLTAGEWIGANAITEAEAGSDVTALRTRAVREGDEYVLDGVKTFVSNGPAADVFLVYAVSDPTLGHLGVSAFAVERDRPGAVPGPPFDKLGLHSCPAGELRLDGCRVPVRNLVGAEGQGAAVFQSSMRWERTCLFAAYLGMMDRLVERCVGHAGDRRQFGRPIGANQAVSHRIADMKLRLEAARMLLYRACWALDRGEPATLEVSMAKVAISEAAVQAGLDGLQIFAGAGYQEETGIAAALRDALPSTIFSGTSEIHRELIAKELGL